MKSRVTCFALCAAVVLTLAPWRAARAAGSSDNKAKAAAAAGAADAKQKPAASGEAPLDPMMAEMMKLATPGPMHEFLKQFVGSWKCVTKSWMGPGEPTVSEGTEADALILGGRFLQSKFSGNFAGMPFEGMGLLGYNNQKKQFESVWIDDMGTPVSWSSGAIDAAGKVITMNSTFQDPITGKEVPYKMVTTVVDANQHTFAMIGSKDGNDWTQMEIAYTREK